MSEAHEARVCELLEKGLQHYGMGEPARALAIWNEVLALDPGNIRAAEYIKFVREGIEGEAASSSPAAIAVAPPVETTAAPASDRAPAGPVVPEAEPVIVGAPVAALAEPPAIASSEAAAARPDEPAPVVAPPPESPARPALDPNDPLAVSWGDLVALADGPASVGPVDAPAVNEAEADGRDAVVPGTEDGAGAAAFEIDVAGGEDRGAELESASAGDEVPAPPPAPDNLLAGTGPEATEALPESVADSSQAAAPASSLTAAAGPAIAGPDHAAGPDEGAPADQPGPDGLEATGAERAADAPDEDDIASIVEVATPEAAVALPPGVAATAVGSSAQGEAAAPEPAAPAVTPFVAEVPPVGATALEAPTPVADTPRGDAVAVPASDEATAAAPSIGGDWSQAIESLSEREMAPVAELLTSAHASPPAPDAPPVLPSLVAAAVAAVPLPASGESRLHLVAPVPPAEPAPAADPWDEGPALSAPVTVQPIDQEFLSPTSGEHAVEVVSQPSGPGTAGDSPRVEASKPEAPADCDRLMQGARDMFELGDFSGSLELVEKVLELDPDNAQARAYLERNQGTLLKMYESKIGSFTQVPRVTIPPDEIIWLNLHHRAGFLLAQIDGLVTFEDLLSLSAMSKLETCKILVQLIGEGVIVAS